LLQQPKASQKRELCLDKISCQEEDGHVPDVPIVDVPISDVPILEVEVIEDPAAAASALDPMRGLLLAELAEPGSAANLAERVGIPRQKVNYHLRALEAHGLVEVAEERKRGGITERVMRATAASYIVSPAALGEDSVDPAQAADRLSARYLIALAGRVVREVGSLSRRAAAAGKRLPTMAIDTEIRFRSAEDRAAFADELTARLLELAAKYHHDDGRPHRLVVAAHPTPPDANRRDPTEETP
jgi:DNA-binding transcriptional ArsR family regulator